MGAAVFGYFLVKEQLIGGRRVKVACRSRAQQRTTASVVTDQTSSNARQAIREALSINATMQQAVSKDRALYALHGSSQDCRTRGSPAQSGPEPR